ncbi:hypothetical protein IQ22_04617 [Pseudomonas duriflava]|uniref:Uncharacterized protein n=1 Tax=Pseudomonas duriflava TaxID=459528 RepID=A0A562PMH5_9PSED|nr:hypothetical protein [Pseudomonas duriflava]TWI45637.1 hypothetical protein IQ22_04617 [Pseudomonas duriflava]
MGLVLTRQESENTTLLLEPDCDEAQILDARRHEDITLLITHAQTARTGS